MEAVKETSGWLAQRAEDDPRRFFSGVDNLWCRLMHDDITWPSHGQYRCRHEFPKQSHVRLAAVLARH